MAHYDDERVALWTEQDEINMAQIFHEGYEAKELNDITNTNQVLPKADELE